MGGVKRPRATWSFVRFYSRWPIEVWSGVGWYGRKLVLCRIGFEATNCLRNDILKLCSFKLFIKIGRVQGKNGLAAKRLFSEK